MNNQIEAFCVCFVEAFFRRIAFDHAALRFRKPTTAKARTAWRQTDAVTYYSASQITCWFKRPMRSLFGGAQTRILMYAQLRRSHQIFTLRLRLSQLADTVILEVYTNADCKMFVVTRRPGEKTILETSDGPIAVMVASIGGQAARLGLDAPQSVRVLREATDAFERTVPDFLHCQLSDAEAALLAILESEIQVDRKQLADALHAIRRVRYSSKVSSRASEHAASSETASGDASA